MKIAIISVIGILVGVFSATAGASPETIRFLTYHNSPPFIIDKELKLGATYELADYLTQSSNGKYIFQTQVLPRKRLNKEISVKCRCAVPWVNPLWFGDKNLEKYNWTTDYVAGSNAVVSSIHQRFEYAGPESLFGKTTSALRGTVWVGLGKHIKEGRIAHIEVDSFLSSLKLVQAGRADVTLIPTSMARYLVAENNLAGFFHFSTNPHRIFQRHFMIANFDSQKDKELQDYIQTLMPYLKDSREWKARMARYGL
ncbi:MAG: transporter substrate-binding domain-containing protein [Pseudomonas marincola]